MLAWLSREGSISKVPSIELAEVEGLCPGAGEVLLKVKAIGLNRADLARRSGHYQAIPTKPPLPVIGLEAAGEVIAIGEGVTGIKLGERLMGMPAGAYAQQALIHHRLAMPIPAELSWEDAASLPVAMLTAHDALTRAGGLQKGSHILIQGVSSGVGIAAIQISKLLGAATVSGTSRSPTRCVQLNQFGLDLVCETQSNELSVMIETLTKGHGTDIVLDMVGGNSVDSTLAASALRARWVQIGRLAGIRAHVDLDLLSKKRIRLEGVTFRTRSIDEFEMVVKNALQDLSKFISNGSLRMPISARFDFMDAVKAQAYMASDQQLGKIILKVSD